MDKHQETPQLPGEGKEWDEEAREQAKMLKAFFGTAKHYFGGFERLFEGVSDPRNADLITYALAGLMFTGAWMFECQLGPHCQIQAKLRGNSRSEAKFEALFRQAFPHGVGSLKNIAFRLLEAWRNLQLSTTGFLSLFNGRFQIRFDSS